MIILIKGFYSWNNLFGFMDTCCVNRNLKRHRMMVKNRFKKALLSDKIFIALQTCRRTRR